MRDRYYGIIADDVVNGEGICVSFWVMGCEHHCPGCHNKAAWNTDLNAGKKLPDDYLEQILHLISKNGVQRNFSMLGGEPLLGINRELVLTILKKVKENYPTIKTYLWTGYVWESIIDQPLVRDIMKYVDVLIDGPFILEKRDISLFLRGSDNQRVIDVQKTIESGSVVLYHD